MQPLVSADWLKQNLNDQQLVIVDVSGEKLYKQEHIPGAVMSDIGQWRTASGKHALLQPPKSIETHMRGLGISNQSKIVVYSHHDNLKDVLKASYVIWAMQTLGHQQVAMLDGGIQAWKISGYKLSKSSPKIGQGDFKARMNKEMVVDLDFVKAHIGKIRMIDARPAVFYYGAKKQGVLAKAGHVPQATSYFWNYSFQGNGLLKPKKELQAMLVEGLGLDPEKPVITYCTGGLETSMNWFVLHNLLGFKKAKLYDASMKEWANRKDTPMRSYRWE